MPSPEWRNTGSLHFARRRLNLVILADGKCLAVGGTGEADSEAKAVLSCELWDPATGAWTVVAPLTEPRMYHSTAILMPDGRVVTAGGAITVGRGGGVIGVCRRPHAMAVRLSKTRTIVAIFKLRTFTLAPSHLRTLAPITNSTTRVSGCCRRA